MGGSRLRFWAWMMAFWLQLDHWVDNVMGCIKLMTTMPTLQRLNTAAPTLWVSLGILLPILEPLARNTRWENWMSDLRHICLIDQHPSFLKPTPPSNCKPSSTKDTCLKNIFCLSFLGKRSEKHRSKIISMKKLGS